MKSAHLSEIEIQQYAMDKSVCGEAVIGHMELCNECAMKAANYRLIFSALKTQSKPAFNFDLNSLVMEKVKEKEIRWSPALSFVYGLLALALISAIVAGYLWRENLMRIFSGVLPLVIYIMIAIAIGIMIFQVVEVFRKYQRKMQSLNSL